MTYRQRKKETALKRLDALRSRHPRHIEARYRRYLLDRVKAVGRIIREEIAEFLEAKAEEIDDYARADSREVIEQEIIRRIAGIHLVIERTWTDREIEDYAAQIAGQLDLYEKRQITRQWKAVVGVDPIFTDRAVRGIMQEFSFVNLRLIKDVPDKLLRQVQHELVDAVREGERASEFQKIVRERLHVAESRARLIARDQIAAMNGALTEVRQRDLGITRYEWSTSEDERVVGTPGGLYPEATNPEMHGNHYERDGQIFEWANPPPDGHPGRPIQCRCVAIPVIEDVI